MAVARLPSKGAELQADDPTVVAGEAARRAYNEYGKPLFVEDTALTIECLNGFPGVYASFVLRTLGLGGVLRLMEGAKNRRAEFVAAVAYCDGGPECVTFRGRLDGTVALRPAGQRGFGYDPVFVPLGSARTLAQMSLLEKSAVSHRAKALRKLAAWLDTRANL